MEFDKSKVFTLVNADDIKIGSKGYFADNVKTLKEAVLAEDSVMFGEVEEIFDEFTSRRFGIKDESNCGFGLFYLVEEPKEKKLRPYKYIDEMVDDFIRRYNHYSGFNGNTNPMWHPLIWIKSKITKNKYLITRFSNSDNTVIVTYENDSFKLSLKTLFNEYIYLDDSPCGIEE